MPVDAYLQAIAEREQEVRAFAWFDAERARRLAAAAEAGAPAGAPLRGVPIGVKDIIDVAGLPTAMGSPLYADNVPTASADLVQRLERAGAFVLGKTVTAELAYLHPGATRNPWNPRHTPGGSSSGSAAAVAAGFAPLAIGTQTNGSVIRPAAFCGVVGFKPSLGAVSTRGVLSWSPTLDQPGWFGRSVRVCRDALEVLREAPIDAAAPAATPRLALVRSPIWPRADEAQRNVLLDAAAALARAGAEVVEAELPPSFARAHAVHWTIMSHEGARWFAGHQRSGLSRELLDLIDRGSRVGRGAYERALQERSALRASLATFLADFDAVLTPPACGEAPASLSTTGNPAFCTIWTLCGVPAITIPVGLGPARLPLGLQIVGRFDDDARLLAVAEWCERQIP